MINCTKCKEFKSEESFRERPNLKRGYHSWCRTCETTANKKRYIPILIERKIIELKSEEFLKLERKKRMLKFRYNLSYEDYEAMYKKQDSKCAICEKYFILGGRKGLYVDHCHDTNTVRGLLCPSCNSGLGMLQNGNLFNNAMNYLNTHEK